MTRRLPVGAEVVEGGTHFRVWAPDRKTVEVAIGRETTPLAREATGHFSGLVRGANAGSGYRFRLDGGASFPDPASRYQPDGPHGDSTVIDPSAFRWTDSGWSGVRDARQIAYEMHVGTFTRDGTFAAAADQLSELASLGVTVLEVMPVAEFPGRFGWGYDGVDLFAPYHGYGEPDDFRGFVNRAHEAGLGVILDVVYNHLGPDGNYLRQFSDCYFSRKHTTEWGAAVNFDDRDATGAREFVLSNVQYWIEEFHLDGLRLDATHSISDESRPHILEDIGRVARQAAGARAVLIVAENERQDPRIVRAPGHGGYGLHHLWCDDFHHSVHVAATGRRESYFTEYRGSAQEIVSLIKHGILYQGQRNRWQKKGRGSPAWDVDAHRLVFYLENHDQVANSLDGRRLHQLTSPGRYRALTALLLLAPQTPLLFQGQEFGASAPFLYFADHNPELAKLVKQGRGEFVRQFASAAECERGLALDDPGATATFECCRLDLSQRERNVFHYALHRDLITLRRCDPVIASGAARIDGAVLGDHAFVVRYFGDGGEDRLLLVNLGADVTLDVAPEPLLAPPDTGGWQRLWHSDDLRYGGDSTPPAERDDGSWLIPAESATLLGPVGN